MRGRIIGLSGRLAAQNDDTIRVRGFFDPKTDSFQGTYEASMPNDCRDEGTLVGRRFDKLSGEWTGNASILGDNGPPVQVTATFSQGSSNQPFAPLAATLSFLGSACFNSGEFDGFVSGPSAHLDRGTLDTTVTAFFGMMVDSKTIDATYLVIGGPCNETVAAGTLVRR